MLSLKTMPVWQATYYVHGFPPNLAIKYQLNHISVVCNIPILIYL